MLFRSNLLYDKRRHQEAIGCWEAAARRDPAFAIVHRNLGIAYFNVQHDSARALASFDRSFEADPLDARVLYERDQLWKRTGRAPQERLNELLLHRDLIDARDDLSVELATLYNQVGNPSDALNLLLRRKFQPWEGGEGLVLAQYARSCILLGRQALGCRKCADARSHFQAALKAPENLSEAKHLLANYSEIYYWIGESFHREHRYEEARDLWMRTALHRGDFQQMSVREISEMTFWSALALKCLGNEDESRQLFQRIYDFSIELEQTDAKVDYFATSLPAMLLFDEDLPQRNRVNALFLRAQALSGLDRKAESENLIRAILGIDRNHAGAADLLSQLGESSQPARVG